MIKEMSFSAYIIPVRDGRIAMLRYGENGYGFIGGRLDDGEDFKTALRRELTEELGIDATALMDDLIEIDGGEIEGICWVDFPETRPELEYAWSMEPHNFHPKGGESMRSVYTRSWRAVKEIVAKNSGKTALLASHGCTIRNIICNALGRPVEQLNTVNWADNTGVFLLRFDGDKLPEILIFNDVSHLPEDCLPAKSRITSLFAKKPVIKKVEEK